MRLPAIGIDPAFRENGFRMVVIDESGEVQQYKFRRFADWLKWVFSEDAPKEANVCVENSNMDKQLYAYHRGKRGQVLATAARNVGANQAVSQCTFDVCAWKWPGSAYQISPKDKGKVWSSDVAEMVMKSEAHKAAGRMDEDGRAAYQCALQGVKMHK